MKMVEEARAAFARRSPDPQARPVLVVEDDAGVRAFLVSVLQHQGYRVIAAATGEEALQLLGMDGFAVADELPPDVPVIIVTGDPIRAYAEAQGRTLNYQVLPKPIAPELLEHAVAAAL